jgi:N-acetylmuramoyl-L-alanine amidase
VALTPAPDRYILRIPVSRRVPFQVSEEARSITVRLYDAAGDVNWIRYGATVPGVRSITWAQEGGDEVTLTVTLDHRVWGYRTRWAQDDLMLEIRRPPDLDEGHPLKGVLVVVDPGHPPAGATGPTGLREGEANLAVSLRLRELLTAEGARVVMTRTDDRDVGLTERTHLADSVNADVLISIHNNALPDGVNPFTSNGSSVYYNHRRSIPLARAVQAELTRAFGTRDLGFGRGDLALVRPTWMPAILTEGLFMMLPDQEAALRSEAGQARYAGAVRDGLVSFLRWRAQEALADARPEGLD